MKLRWYENIYYIAKSIPPWIRSKISSKRCPECKSKDTEYWFSWDTWHCQKCKIKF